MAGHASSEAERPMLQRKNAGTSPRLCRSCPDPDGPVLGAAGSCARKFLPVPALFSLVKERP